MGDILNWMRDEEFDDGDDEEIEEERRRSQQELQDIMCVNRLLDDRRACCDSILIHTLGGAAQVSRLVPTNKKTTSTTTTSMTKQVSAAIMTFKVMQRCRSACNESRSSMAAATRSCPLASSAKRRLASASGPSNAGFVVACGTARCFTTLQQAAATRTRAPTTRAPRAPPAPVAARGNARERHGTMCALRSCCRCVATRVAILAMTATTKPMRPATRMLRLSPRWKLPSAVAQLRPRASSKLQV